MKLQPICENLWVIEHPFCLLKAHIGTHTTLLRLSNGGLWLLSPGPELSLLETNGHSRFQAAFQAAGYL